MSDRYHDAAVAYKEANPVPNPDDLQLMQVGELVTREFDVPERTATGWTPSDVAWNRPWLRTAVAVAAIVIVLLGLIAVLDRASDESVPVTQVPVPTTQATTPDTTLPGTNWDDIPAWAAGSRGPGEFRSLHFEPAFRFELPAGWITSTEGANTTAAVRPIELEAESGISAIYIYSHDGLDNTVVASRPGVQELIDWISANGSAANVVQSAVEIGGLPATKIDFDLTRHMLYIRTRGVDGPNLIHDFEEDHEVAIYVLDVDDHTVSIVLEAEPTTDLETLEIAAQDVLDSIVWRHLED